MHEAHAHHTALFAVQVYITIRNLPEHAGEEVEEDAVLLGELGAEGADGLHHHNLELVRDLGDEAGNLLHQPVHARLRPGFQQGGDRQRRDGPIRICR
jgi:hypothetical protein